MVFWSFLLPNVWSVHQNRDEPSPRVHCTHAKIGKVFSHAQLAFELGRCHVVHAWVCHEGLTAQDDPDVGHVDVLLTTENTQHSKNPPDPPMKWSWWKIGVGKKDKNGKETKMVRRRAQAKIG